jgi:DNA-binding NarL/FixJ family response regulator
VIVSDDPLFVETTSLGFRANPGFLVFHCVPSTRALAQAVARVGADVVMIDGPPAVDSQPWAMIRDLRAQLDPPAILVFSDLADGDRDQASLEAGATMVLARQILGGSLVGLVAAVAAGHVVVRPAGAAATPIDDAPSERLVRVA